jgi:uncharacterized protein YcaQ
LNSAGGLIDEKALNRAVLARQILLRRTDETIPRALERMGGLQAQYAPSSYVGLWSRRAGMQRSDLDRALEDQTAVQGTLMRVTIHLVSRADYWLFAAGVRRARRQMWLRLVRGEWTEEQMEALADRTRELLAGGPRKRADLLRELGLDNGPWVGVGLWVDLVRVPPSGTWSRRRADLYGLAEDCVGPEDVSEEEGIDHLVRRYLAAFGPAAVGDLVSWSGLPAAMLAPRLEALQSVRFKGPAGRELIDLPGAPLPDPETPAPVRFLPTWDASLLVHCRRAGILPEEYRPRVFHSKNPQSVATFLVDGRVAGTWRNDRGKVTLDPFTPLDPAVRREAEEEAGRLESFLE